MLEYDKNFADKLLNRILKGFQSQRLLNMLGLAVRRIIQDRTRKGVDVEGKPFKEYSKGHARKREKLDLPVYPVNLQMDDVEGMLRKIDHAITREFEELKVFIDDPEKEQIARYHNILGAGKSKVIRRFWGLNDTEINKIHQIVGLEIANVLKKL